MKEWKRSHRKVRHHITNKCDGGTSEQSNLFVFDENKERAFHFLFGNKSFEEVAELLLRCCKMKRR